MFKPTFNKNWLAALLLLPVGGTALAAKPVPDLYSSPQGVYNYWYITFYDDTSPWHSQWATQGLCFSPPVALGTGVTGRVVSLTFPNWSGVYWGDGGNEFQIKMNYAPDNAGGFIGNDFISFELDSKDSGAGESGWDEWRDNFVWNVWGNVRMQRAGRCHHLIGADKITAEEIRRIAAQVPPQYTAEGKLAEVPLTRGIRVQKMQIEGVEYK